MRIFLCRTGRNLILLLPILVLACGDKTVDPQASLNTSPRHRTGTWEGTPIHADIMWRFISAEPFSDRVAITGSWSITFRNASVNTYIIHTRRLTFEDTSGFQIAEHIPTSPFDTSIDSFTIDGAQTERRTGNFSIYVDSVDTANTIMQINVYLSIDQIN